MEQLGHSWPAVDGTGEYKPCLCCGVAFADFLHDRQRGRPATCPGQKFAPRVEDGVTVIGPES